MKHPAFVGKCSRLLVLVVMLSSSSCLVLPPEVAAELEPAAATQSNHFRHNRFGRNHNQEEDDRE